MATPKKIAEIKSKLEAIKKINDNPNLAVDDIYDKYLKDLPSTDQLFGKKLDDFLEKRRKKRDNNKDIFAQIIDIADSFLETHRNVEGSDKFMSKQRLKIHAIDSLRITLKSSKSIISTNVKNIFFAGDGICGTNKSISGITMDSVTILPKEIDFLNMLTISPDSNSGKIMYEPASPDLKRQKVNRELFNSFTGPSYQFDTINNKTLFTSTWDSTNQAFNISGLTQGLSVQVEDFFNDYYSSIEFPDINGIIKTAMLLTIQNDGTDPLQFNVGLNKLERLLKKLFTLCGTPQNPNKLVNQNATDLFNENDQELDYYFDFETVEGVDFETEDARLRNVLKFKDCNNFEIPANSAHIEDFVYLTDKKTINDVVNKTLSKAATDAFEKSDSSIPLANFHLSLFNNFILNLPKALMSCILSPKLILPIVIIYKLFVSVGNQVIQITDLMKRLSKLFYGIIKDLFWKFLREFWKLLKVDLSVFVSKLVAKIIKNKYKRYVAIINSIIKLLEKILQTNIDNCSDLFSAILNTITTAISATGGFNVPGVLLGFSDFLPGYSQDRAFLNIVERMESAGVPTGPLFGEANDLLSVIKSTIDGHIEENDTNGFVKVSNKEMIIPTPVGPVIIPPGILNSVGKLF
jgi:hypothetical protein